MTKINKVIVYMSIKNKKWNIKNTNFCKKNRNKGKEENRKNVNN